MGSFPNQFLRMCQRETLEATLHSQRMNYGGGYSLVNTSPANLRSRELYPRIKNRDHSDHSAYITSRKAIFRSSKVTWPIYPLIRLHHNNQATMINKHAEKFQPRQDATPPEETPSYQVESYLQKYLLH